MNKNLLLPIAKELQGQATLILKGSGLSLLKPSFFNINLAQAALESEAFLPGGGSEHFDKIGMLGLPVFDTVTLSSPKFTDNAGKENLPKDFTLDIALIVVSSSRHIVTTEIAGRNGSIKEYMSNGDSSISIKGVLVNNIATIAPYQLIKELNFMATCPESLKVESNFLSYLDISSLVIKEITFNQKEAMRNVVEYEIKCISDVPFELKNA